MRIKPLRSFLVPAAFLATHAFAQSVPNVSQVLTWSTLTDRPVVATGGPFSPSATGTVNQALFSVYTSTVGNAAGDGNAFLAAINNPRNYQVAHASALTSALATNIALTLSAIPLASPTSGRILKTDPATGAQLPVSASLGPIFTQRAETVGKRNWFVGFTHQNYHFTRFNGQSMNGMSVLYGGNDPSGITIGSAKTTTAPATFNLGLDVRLSQDIAFVTYGLTDRFDVSVGLPIVHAAVASRSYNGVVYSGSGTDFDNGSQCWCVNTLSPGSFQLSTANIGQASKSKTGFGDMLLRFKGGVFEREHASLAVGADLRLPTGEAENFLGTGTTNVKPFAALSLYSKRFDNGLVFAPHVEAGWLFGGKTILGGTLQGTAGTAQLSGGVTVPVVVAPFTYTKDYLPDILTWGVGTEVAIGQRNTLVFDVIGNQIGLVRSGQLLSRQDIKAPAPTALAAGTSPVTSALGDAGRGSFGQYSGAFGYKARIMGGLVASFQALVRFDSNGLTTRVVPLFGLGYGFGR